MPLPSSGALETLDYAFDGQPFDYLAKVGTQGLDYAFDGQPFYGTQTTQNLTQAVTATAAVVPSIPRSVGVLKLASSVLVATLVTPVTYIRTLTVTAIQSTATLITLLKLALHQAASATGTATATMVKQIGKILRAR